MSYPHLNRIGDAGTYDAVKHLYDLLFALQTRIDRLEATQAGLDGHGQRIQHVADGTASTDAATLGQVRALAQQLGETF